MVIGLITGECIRNLVKGLVAWHEDNNLSLNAENIKEINIDPRRRKQQHVSIGIGETEMYEGETLSISRRRISQHPAAPEEVTAEDGLFLRRLRKFGMLTNIFSNTSTVKSCSFQRVIKNAQRISGGEICRTRIIKRAHNVIKDKLHQQHSLFTLTLQCENKNKQE